MGKKIDTLQEDIREFVVKYDKADRLYHSGTFDLYDSKTSGLSLDRIRLKIRRLLDLHQTIVNLGTATGLVAEDLVSIRDILYDLVRSYEKELTRRGEAVE